MRFLLDTNVVSELRKADAANAGVQLWFSLAAPADLYLSVLVIGELRHGIELLRRRDPASAVRLDHWLATVTSSFPDRILPIGPDVADQWGPLGVPDPVPAVDALLAATALVHDMTLVSRTSWHLSVTGARCLDPFT